MNLVGIGRRVLKTVSIFDGAQNLAQDIPRGPWTPWIPPNISQGQQETQYYHISPAAAKAIYAYYHSRYAKKMAKPTLSPARDQDIGQVNENRDRK